jgi:hypothetical protein
MKSAFDCFQQAAKYDHLASTASNDASRSHLLATADHWRVLGKAAKIRERRAENYPLRASYDKPSEYLSEKTSPSPRR